MAKAQGGQKSLDIWQLEILCMSFEMKEAINGNQDGVTKYFMFISLLYAIVLKINKNCSKTSFKHH